MRRRLPNAPEPERLLHRLPNAAARLDLTYEAIRALVRKGLIKTVRCGRAVFVTEDELRRFIASLA